LVLATVRLVVDCVGTGTVVDFVVLDVKFRVDDICVTFVIGEIVVLDTIVMFAVAIDTFMLEDVVEKVELSEMTVIFVTFAIVDCSIVFVKLVLVTFVHSVVFLFPDDKLVDVEFAGRVVELDKVCSVILAQCVLEIFTDKVVVFTDPDERVRVTLAIVVCSV
jgi:hypothetical protein